MEQGSAQAEKTVLSGKEETGGPGHSGAYVICVCAGANCFQRQAQSVYQAVRDWLKNDDRFSLETVPCLGVCGMPPAISVNGKIYGKMTPRSVVALLESLRKSDNCL